MLEPLRDAVRGVTGDQVLYEVRTLEQLAAASLARQRFMMMVLGIFAVLGDGAGVHRDLWRAGLLDRPARAGNWFADGAGRERAGCVGDGDAAERR